jgi:hypothetical protein
MTIQSFGEKSTLEDYACTFAQLVLVELVGIKAPPRQSLHEL